MIVSFYMLLDQLPTDHTDKPTSTSPPDSGEDLEILHRWKFDELIQWRNDFEDIKDSRMSMNMIPHNGLKNAPDPRSHKRGLYQERAAGKVASFVASSNTFAHIKSG